MRAKGLIGWLTVAATASAIGCSGGSSSAPVDADVAKAYDTYKTMVSSTIKFDLQVKLDRSVQLPKGDDDKTLNQLFAEMINTDHIIPWNRQTEYQGPKTIDSLYPKYVSAKVTDTEASTAPTELASGQPVSAEVFTISTTINGAQKSHKAVKLSFAQNAPVLFDFVQLNVSDLYHPTTDGKPFGTWSCDAQITTTSLGIDCGGNANCTTDWDHRMLWAWQGPLTGHSESEAGSGVMITTQPSNYNVTQNGCVYNCTKQAYSTSAAGQNSRGVNANWGGYSASQSASVQRPAKSSTDACGRDTYNYCFAGAVALVSGTVTWSLTLSSTEHKFTIMPGGDTPAYQDSYGGYHQWKEQGTCTLQQMQPEGCMMPAPASPC